MNRRHPSSDSRNGWVDSYEKRFGVRPIKDEEGYVVKAVCQFCQRYGREERCNKNGRKMHPRQVVKEFTSIRVDRIKEHVQREHSLKWRYFQTLSDEDRKVFFEPPSSEKLLASFLTNAHIPEKSLPSPPPSKKPKLQEAKKMKSKRPEDPVQKAKKPPEKAHFPDIEDQRVITKPVCKKPNKSPQEQILTFMPLHSISQWYDHETSDGHLSVAILLPSGVCEAEFSLGDGGKSLDVRVKWPEIMTNVAKLHAKWLQEDPKFTQNNPKVIGFQHFVEQHQHPSNNSIHSTATIQLPVRVEDRILDISRIGSSDGSRIAYVELRQTQSDRCWYPFHGEDFEIYE